MNRIIIIFIYLLVNGLVFSQHFFASDSLPNNSRTIGVSTAVVTGWSGSMIGLSQVWYKDNWQGGFHFFKDGNEWMQMDKVGHAYTANHITRGIFELYNWTGQSRKKSLLLGSIIGFGYLANLEVFDGFSNEWGFSWSDLAANGMGTAWFVGQELVWNEQRLLMKFSSSYSSYAQYRPEVLGSSGAERILKDYNGQTYWLSASPRSFSDLLSFWPKWLALSFGYSVDGKLVGSENVYTVEVDNSNSKTFMAQRQFLFSLDIDFERIPAEKPFVKALFKVLNHVKVPFPALVYGVNDKFRFSPLYF
jgi:hypothetical protein